jgi:uncharacterized protein YjbI with pentapeptide repeats
VYLIPDANDDPATLEGAFLMGANFDEATLYRASFRGAHFDATTTFDGTRLDRTNFEGATGLYSYSRPCA